MSYKTFCISCVICGGVTSKSYSRTHDGRCKQCATGESKRGLKCPTCGEHTLTSYQKAHHYHCDACTRQVEAGY